MLIRTYADIEKLQGEDAPSAAERLLIDNCKRGEPTVLGDGTLPDGPNPRCTVRAGLLRYLILGGCDRCQVNERGVLLSGAHISGKLDLSFTQATGSTELDHCRFEMPIAAQLARFDYWRLVNSNLPGINAENSVIKGDVVLDGLRSTGEITFAGAEIGDQLSCLHGDLSTLQGQALNAQSANVKGGVFLAGSKIRGEVSFSGAVIGGQLVGADADLDGGEGTALNAEGAKVAGGVYLRGLKSRGEISFAGAEVGVQFECSKVNLDCGSVSGKAFVGQRMIVKGGFFWRDVEHVIGTVDLNAAFLGDLVDDEKSWKLVPNFILVGMRYESLPSSSDLSWRKAWLSKGAAPKGDFHPQPYQQLAKFYRETGHSHEAREILIEKEKEQRKAGRASIRSTIHNYESDLWPSMKSVLPVLIHVRRRYIDLFLPWLKIGLSWFWDVLSRRITGYGYKPWLSFGPLLTLVVAMAILSQITWNKGDFTPNSDVILTSSDWKAYADGTAERPPSGTPAADWSDGPDRETGKGAGPGRDYETFNALAYGVDVVVPVLNLGQTAAWAPSTTRGPWGRWLFYMQKLFIIAGWGVTAIAAAAISGMIRRDD